MIRKNLPDIDEARSNGDHCAAAAPAKTEVTPYMFALAIAGNNREEILEHGNDVTQLQMNDVERAAGQRVRAKIAKKLRHGEHNMQLGVLGGSLIGLLGFIGTLSYMIQPKASRLSPTEALVQKEMDRDQNNSPPRPFALSEELAANDLGKSTLNAVEMKRGQAIMAIFKERGHRGGVIPELRKLYREYDNPEMDRDKVIGWLVVQSLKKMHSDPGKGVPMLATIAGFCHAENIGMIVQGENSPLCLDDLMQKGVRKPSQNGPVKYYIPPLLIDVQLHIDDMMDQYESRVRAEEAAHQRFIGKLKENRAKHAR